MSDWVKAYCPRSGESLSARTVRTSLRTSELNSSIELSRVDVRDGLDHFPRKTSPEHRTLFH